MNTPLPSPSLRRLPRVPRREAATILGCSRDNVRRLERTGQLTTTKADRNGTVTYDRREVEDLARRRGALVRTTGALTARVFALFKAKRSFADVCIETEQDADTIRRLWEQFRGGYDLARQSPAKDQDEARAEREHAEQMRAFEEELGRRRAREFGGGDAPAERRRKIDQRSA